MKFGRVFYVFNIFTDFLIRSRSLTYVGSHVNYTNTRHFAVAHHQKAFLSFSEHSSRVPWKCPTSSGQFSTWIWSSRFSTSHLATRVRMISTTGWVWRKVHQPRMFKRLSGNWPSNIIRTSWSRIMKERSRKLRRIFERLQKVSLPINKIYLHTYLPSTYMSFIYLTWPRYLMCDIVHKCLFMLLHAYLVSPYLTI